MRMAPKKNGPEILAPPERVSAITSSGNQMRSKLRGGVGLLNPTSRHQPKAEIRTIANTTANARYRVSALFIEEIACSNSEGCRVCSGESSPASPTTVSGKGSRPINMSPNSERDRSKEKISGRRSANLLKRSTRLWKNLRA